MVVGGDEHGRIGSRGRRQPADDGHGLQGGDDLVVGMAVQRVHDQLGHQPAARGHQHAHELVEAHRDREDLLHLLAPTFSLGSRDERQQHRRKAIGQQVHAALGQRTGDVVEADVSRHRAQAQQVGVHRFGRQHAHQRQGGVPAHALVELGLDVVGQRAVRGAQAGAAHQHVGDHRVQGRCHQEQQQVGIQSLLGHEQREGRGRGAQADQRGGDGLGVKDRVALGRRDLEHVQGAQHGAQHHEHQVQHQPLRHLRRVHGGQEGRGQQQGAHARQRQPQHLAQPQENGVPLLDVTPPHGLGDEADGRDVEAAAGQAHGGAHHPDQVGVDPVGLRPQPAGDENAVDEAGDEDDVARPRHPLGRVKGRLLRALDVHGSRSSLVRKGFRRGGRAPEPPNQGEMSAQTSPLRMA